ncbi:hypothetical protein KDA_23850 [Dictyobacter alpinus]|uniref:Uncharacterized protein n=1 Tax=Dictyobacter alpinus TaxID=2014873 RepID=A0A402B6B9_9CHLR|nr:hypothetical protein KDA_23850 [Dictyobacter alpinus]
MDIMGMGSLWAVCGSCNAGDVLCYSYGECEFNRGEGGSGARGASADGSVDSDGKKY